MADRTGPKEEGAAFDGMTIGGKYVVRDVIGEGGMGVVLAAENTAIQLPVAIKLLHKVLVKNETSMERFQREARAAAATGHAHIVEIYDMGETDEGAPFIVMEMLDGKNLQQALRKEKVLEPERAAKICIQLLSALSAVHAKGILHRDLKPANVILVEKKRKKDYVKLVDFGISKIHEHGREQSHLTATGVVMGTPHYMSPEQARGEKEIDHRADLYAVGAILYRCVCGKVPYPGKNYNQILAKILAQPPPPVLEIRPQAPPRIATIINRAMARHPESRYESAAAFAADLADFCKMDISVPTSQGMRASVAQMEAVGSTAQDEEQEATAETVAVNHRAAKKPMNPPSGILREAPGRTPQSSGSWRPARNLKSVPQEILSVEQTPDGTTQQMGQRPVSSTVKMARGKKVTVSPESPESVSTGAPTNVAPESARAPAPEGEDRPPSRKHWLWIGGAFVVLLVAVGVFFGVRGMGKEETPDSNEQENKAGGKEPQKKPLRFALGQHLPAKKRRRIYHDVGEYLKKNLQRPVEILTPEDLTGLGKKLVSGEYDILAISPLLYVKLKRKHPAVEVIATPRFRRAAHYQGLILARSKDGINELGDLKGKRFCWVSRHST